MNALAQAPAQFEAGLRPLSDEAAGDYAVVQAIVRMISENWRDQPGIEDIAAKVGLTVTQTHTVFRRWCGLTPKDFLSAVTLDQARRVLPSEPNCWMPVLSSACPAPGGCMICSSRMKR